jgi:hypothetical protein
MVIRMLKEYSLRILIGKKFIYPFKFPVPSVTFYTTILITAAGE